MQVFAASASLQHDPGPGHPERPERLATVLRTLRGAAGVKLVEPPPAPLDLLLTRHSRRYLDQIAVRGRARGNFGPDTPVGPASWDSALAATGAALGALRHALSGRGHGFAAIRPPGHHALAESGMGFCLLNHVAILSAVGRTMGCGRVLIIDWDVHHGNGTQAMVEGEAETRFVSMHQWPWYPGTGAASERGVGNCFNLPMPAGLDRARYVEVLWDGIVAATDDWVPDLVLISAGYDAMRGDPLGGFSLEPADFATWVTRLRERFPSRPIVALMEGGYDPDRLAAGVMATVDALR
ncbi:MAG: histone deacetylase [Gemmatimonadota bacterium]